MKTIRVKKGHDLKIIGVPGDALRKADAPTHLAFVPARIPFFKPRLKIKEGDQVALGSPLVEDKRNTDIRLLSPGGGQVTRIRFGPRRVIQEINIQLDQIEKTIEFERYGPEDISKMNRAELVQILIAGGLWPLIKALPFRDYPHPDSVPPALYVSLDNLEPFHPKSQVYLSGNERFFDFGLSVLNKLAEGGVYVCQHRSGSGLASLRNGTVNLTYEGPYPAHDPGVLLYHMKSSQEENCAWFIEGQDVVLIARFLLKGLYPTERIVSLGGSGARQPGHVITRIGAPLSVIAADKAKNNGLRYIQGGILTGYTSPTGSYLGFSESALNLLPEGDHKGELLDLFNPGYRKPTFSRAFLSALNKDDLGFNCNMHGGERACIACGYCALVCPVDILPQFTYKAILAGEVEEALEHGLLDCVECALCSYVCPSKIELSESLQNAKSNFYREKERIK